jgi:RNA recognition motif-containing protein
MGFGFVNFESNVPAMAAMAELNGKRLREDKIMKVSIARPAWKANIHSNLYVAGLPTSFTESDVMDFLGVYARTAENVRLLRDTSRNPRGAAVVRMSSEDASNDVISALHGVPFRGAIVQIQPWRPEFRVDRVTDDLSPVSLPAKRKPLTPLLNLLPSAAASGDESDLPVLFFYNLPLGMGEDGLTELCAPYSRVEFCRVIDGGKGFAVCQDFPGAMSVLKNLNNLNKIKIEFRK